MITLDLGPSLPLGKIICPLKISAKGLLPRILSISFLVSRDDTLLRRRRTRTPREREASSDSSRTLAHSCGISGCTPLADVVDGWVSSAQCRPTDF